MTRSSDHVLLTGTQDEATIEAGTKIEAFPLQTDQGGGVPPWLAPRRDGTTIPEPAQIVQALDFSQVESGFYTWQWTFDYWTFDMMDYILDTFFTTTSVRVRSKAVSAKTFDKTDTSIYLNATALQPHGDPAEGGWANVVIEFTGGTIAT